MSDYDSDFPGNFTNDEDYDNWFHTDKIMNSNMGDFSTKKHSNYDDYDANSFAGSFPAIRHNPLKNTMKFRKDICVKVEEDIYELDGVLLALKSDYFERLLTSKFNDKDRPFIEINSTDSGTFSAIVDVIYGEELSQVINFDNYASLLFLMDYLQMEINLDTFRDIVDWNMKKPVFLKSNLCKLLDFVVQNANFEYLSSTIYQYLSTNFIDILVCDDFPTLSLAQLEEIIGNDKFPQYDEEKCKMGQICATWICADIENRLDHVAVLVNAAKYRYDLPFKVKTEDLDVNFLRYVEEDMKHEAVERYFDVMLNYYGEIDPSDNERESTRKKDVTKDTPSTCVIVNKTNENAKWAKFLEHGHLYDITVKVQNKTYKLHRLKLESASEYFDQLSTNAINKDEEHLLEDVDQIGFEILIKFIYLDEISLAPGNIASVLKASHILKVKNLIEICQLCIRENAQNIAEDFVELLNFTRRKSEYKEVYDILLNVVVETWPEISIFPNFSSLSCDNLLTVVSLKKLKIKQSDEMLNMCSKWIAYDAKNRYRLMLRIATTINRNYMAVYGRHGMEMEINLVDDYSQELVKNKLWVMLSSTCIVPCVESVLNRTWNFDEDQIFISRNDDKFSIFDATMNKTASMCLFKTKDEFSQMKSGPYNRSRQSSAAVVKDNVFVLHKINDQNYFTVYNLRSKKFYSLASADYQTNRSIYPSFKLLNCKDELYCCFNDGQVLKYSIELNRWMVVFESRWHEDIDKDCEYKIMVHVSDGKALYRVYRKSKDNFLRNSIFANYQVEMFNVQQNVWVPLPELYSKQPEVSCGVFYYESFTRVCDEVTIIGDLAILFFEVSTILLFDYYSQRWREVILSFAESSEKIVSIFTRCEKDEMYVTTTTKVYRVTVSNGKYVLLRTLECNANAAHAIAFK